MEKTGDLEAKNEVTEGMWADALERVNRLKERAMELMGYPGVSMWFYLMTLSSLVTRYNQGERTQCLYDEMMEVEEWMKAWKDKVLEKQGDDAAYWKTRAEKAEATLQAEKDFHPRAMKLISKRKSFLVVANDEPYYRQVYDLIRDHEMLAGTWTTSDQWHYEDALAALKGGNK